MKKSIGEYLYESIRKANSKQDLGLQDLERTPQEAVSDLTRKHYEQNTKKYFASQDKKFDG